MFNVRQAGIEAAAKVIKEQREGTFERVMFSEDFETGAMTLKEMIGTDDGAREWVEKVTYDVAAGRDNVNLAYKDIYVTKTDPNFPLTLTEKQFGQVQVVFLEKFEGGEVKFGTLGAGVQKSVTFHTWAAGIEYDEDMIEYNETWRVTDIGEAFGNSYSKLLNNLHMSPIVSGSYTTTGGGLVAQKNAQNGDLSQGGAGATAQLVAYDGTSIASTLQKALTILPAGTLLLVNSLDIPALENALAGAMNADLSPNFVKRSLSVSDFRVYEGDTIVVGGKTYTYAGVAAGTCYLVAAKSGNFIEYIKHDLRVDSDNGDLSRLIVAQVVGRARRAVLAALGGRGGAVKIALS